MKTQSIVDSVKGGWISKLILNGIGVKVTSEKTISSFQVNESGEVLTEARSMTFKEKGGMIIFSTDVNAAIPSGETFLEKIKVWVKRRLATLRNIVRRDTLVHRIIGRHTEPEFYAFTLGRFFLGQYKANDGSIFNESSLSLEVVGISPEVLERVSSDIARELQQETVLVKDYQTGEIYLADKT